VVASAWLGWALSQRGPSVTSDAPRLLASPPMGMAVSTRAMGDADAYASGRRACRTSHRRHHHVSSPRLRPRLAIPDLVPFRVLDPHNCRQRSGRRRRPGPGHLTWDPVNAAGLPSTPDTPSLRGQTPHPCPCAHHQELLPAYPYRPASWRHERRPGHGPARWSNPLTHPTQPPGMNGPPPNTRSSPGSQLTLGPGPCPPSASVPTARPTHPRHLTHTHTKPPPPHHPPKPPPHPPRPHPPPPPPPSPNCTLPPAPAPTPPPSPPHLSVFCFLGAFSLLLLAFFLGFFFGIFPCVLWVILAVLCGCLSVVRFFGFVFLSFFSFLFSFFLPLPPLHAILFFFLFRFGFFLFLCALFSFFFVLGVRFLFGCLVCFFRLWFVWFFFVCLFALLVLWRSWGGASAGAAPRPAETSPLDIAARVGAVTGSGAPGRGRQPRPWSCLVRCLVSP